MKKAFTLMELSIVLVVLGLLIGAVLAGQSLLRSSEIRKSLTNMEKFRLAIGNFKDKYDEKPGDIPDAQKYWPLCTDNSGDASNSCNGNGDSRIDLTVTQEPLRVFEHLTRAGMIEGSYDGNAENNRTSSPTDAIIGLTRYLYYDDAIAGPYWPDRAAGHFLQYSTGGQMSATTEDIYNMDRKADDGNGIKGLFRISPQSIPTPGCIDPADGAYLPQSPSDNCNVFVKISD